MYDDGRVVPRDCAEAVHWYRIAADQGHAAAEHALASLYHEGDGLPQDHIEALRWRKSAGVPRDDAEALRWYQKAADQGEASAQQSLRFLHAKGKGTEQDFQEAARWCRKAADQGDALAPYHVGSLY